MTRYINQLHENTAPVTGDYLLCYDVSAAAGDEDRWVNVGKFAVLANAQSFTTTQTIAPATTGAHGFVVNMPTSTSGSAITVQYNAVNRLVINAGAGENSINLLSFDNGASLGPYFVIGRNSNASTPQAGWMRLTGKTGNSNDIWVDASATPGVLRIGNATTSSTDLGGSVVGAQTSSLDTKDVIGEFSDNDAALDVIVNTPLFEFYYKDNRLGKPKFLGIITDYSPIFGADPDPAHPNGRILNEVNGHGYAMAAIKALAAKVRTLEGRLNA